MAFLELKNIKKSFGDAHIIKGVDLAIEKGEFIVFVGPSGCGKSTLLRLIAGLEPVSSGQMLLDGRDITYAPSGKRDLAMVFQSYALYPHMSVYDNMSFALKLGKVPEAQIRQKVEAAAAKLNLGNYLQRTPKELSGGQRQRVAIGRAIVRAPKVFLFDEPLSNLDAALRGNTRVEIKKLHESLGATTIYVTHDQVEAMTLADKVVVLKDGLIEQVGSPLELYDRPANQFVAQFIGMPSMNMLPATSLPMVSQLTGGQLPSDGFLGVRPEGVRVHPGAGAGMPGRVELVEALGADTLIHVDVGGVTMIARQNERTPLQSGDDVGVEIDPSVLHLFTRDGRAVAAA
ncbi:MAG: ABC transporter ATP-binding protein [Pseudomonadota bacterium]|nr:ABC transporter ATP-binding protein [Pseudomonadota bacterium]MDQ7999973.1 ABC transporter ATP-binding protein [Pseudomonadota bacterium]MDQ8015479.1 ABC transporter ATP-binding protein [Pseudomonadota bacterium]